MTSEIECVPVELTDYQRANLAQLARHLWTLPADYPDFEMRDFVHGQTDDERRLGARVVTCGTAACAVGHGPRAGILPREGETWWSYSWRSFAKEGRAWDWPFGGDWSKYDNTVHGAAARIEFMLERGLPRDWSSSPDEDFVKLYADRVADRLAASHARKDA